MARRGGFPVKVGPVGASNGVEWDDGVRGHPKEILISHGTSVNSIQIVYHQDGDNVLATKHGTDGFKFESVIQLSDPIIILAGHYGALTINGKSEMVRSLRFSTVNDSYGPFGTEDACGTPFWFKYDGGFVGFHGRSIDGHLRAIGVHVRCTGELKVESGPPVDSKKSG